MTTLGPLLPISQLQSKYSTDLTQCIQGFVLVTQEESWFAFSILESNHATLAADNSVKSNSVNIVWDFWLWKCEALLFYIEVAQFLEKRKIEKEENQTKPKQKAGKKVGNILAS